MELTKNKAVLDWIDQQVKLTQPKEVIWIDGSEEQLEALRDGSLRHRRDVSSSTRRSCPAAISTAPTPTTWPVWRDRTFICSSKKEDAGPTNNWMDPEEMYAMLNELYDGSYEGPYHVRHPLLHGPHRLSLCQDTASS